MYVRYPPMMGAFAAATAALAACNASTTIDPVPPVTGIRVDTLGLFGVDSCGPGDDQVAKTAVTVTDVTASGEAGLRAADVSRSGTFDCFADPAFIEPFAISAEYKLRVFGFSARRYQEHAADIATALAQRNDAAVAADATLASLADVVATCQAFEYANVNSTAACVLDFDRRSGAADAGSVDAASDAGEVRDAGDAATDAGDASDAATATDAAAAADSAADDAGDGGS